MVIRRKAAENELQGTLDELVKKGATIVAVVPDAFEIGMPDFLHLTGTVSRYRVYYVPPKEQE